MMRWLGTLVVVGCAATTFGADELPAPDEDQPLEIEPPLLIENRMPDEPLSNAKGRQNGDGELDVAKCEADLESAKKSAASGERLFKAGILARVEVEERALKVVRFEAKLADAQLQEAQRNVGDLKSASSGDEAFTRELQAAEAAVAEASEIAARAAEARRVAEVEAAARNVDRQQKLLALGSGRKADVNRAEEKLAELKRAEN